MGYLDYAGLQYLWGKLKEKFAPKSHSHDDRYYTEAEVDGMLNSKVNNNEAGADSLLSKLTTSWTATPTDNTYFIRQDTGGGDSFGRVKFSTLWNYIKGKTNGVYQPKGNYSTTDTKNTAGSTNTTSKLYLIGSTSQSTNPQTYSNASVYTTGSTIYANGFGNDIFIIYPSGGSASYGGQQIGYCKITLPTLWDSTMMTFTVTIYNYVSNTSVDYRISGYNYSGKPWYNCAAVCVGKAGTSHSNLSVRFGDNGTKNVITIGEEDTEWEYPRIVVHDVVIGNSNFETYKSGWNVEISKSGAPNVSETISNTHVGYNAVTSWDKIQNKPSSYAPASHTHDDRYYTESEVNIKLANYQPKGNYAAAEHTHNYAGSGNAGGSANSAVKLDSSAGSATQPVYFKDGKPVATTYALNKTVPADAKFTDTNTWRGIQNNLTSDSTDQSLSAAQGKALKTLVDGKAPTSHKHTKSQITDFPTSMPASDVSAWAKAATKPSYTKAEVGLGNVDNTADKDKNVKFATSAGSATNAQCLNNDSQYMRFHWNGQSGQPSWLWGGSDASNMYVYNPSNFSVNYANSAGTTLDAPYTITYEGTYTGTGEYTGSASLPIRHTLSKSYDLVYFIKNLKGWYTPGLIDLFSQGNYGKQYVAMNMLPTTFTLITDLSPNKITMYNGGSNTSTSGQWANRNYIRRNGNSIEFYSTYSSNNADYFFNDKYTSYYIFGFNLNHSLFHYDV